ncbi:MAG: 4-alpha-glucanotransferase, partial [Alphaproteobacteria bacterium]
MTRAPTALDLLAARMGIVESYKAFDRTQRVTSPAAKRALLAAMGCAADTDRRAAETLAEIDHDDAGRIAPREVHGVAGAPLSVATTQPVTWRLSYEDDAAPGREGRSEAGIDLPVLPIGLHRLHVAAGTVEQTTLLIVAPPRAPSVAETTGAAKLWGVTAALYGLSSDRNLAIGDYDDLGALAEGLAVHGADFVGINPVHAVGMGATAPISPYSPSHRAFFNTRHIAVDRAADLTQSPVARHRLNEATPALTALRTVDLVQYPATDFLRTRILDEIFASFEQAAGLDDERAEFAAFMATGGVALHRFALYEAICEVLGPPGATWPVALQSSATAMTAGEAQPYAPRVRYHAWLQWLANTQLAVAQQRAKTAGMRLGLYLDIAVGARPDGAEVWSNRDAFANGIAQGAPPDPFSRDGQNWGLAPFSPAGLVKTGYGPFNDMLRAAMRHAGLVRIDHILGFARAFWLPATGEPGAYVSYPLRSLLALTAIEAHRAGCVVVGEDLGLMVPKLRRQLDRAGLYGCAVAQLERRRDGVLRAPAAYKKQSMASFGNHDMPTLRGYVQGCDIDWLVRLGRVQQADAADARAARAVDVADLAKACNAASARELDAGKVH